MASENSDRELQEEMQRLMAEVETGSPPAARGQAQSSAAAGKATQKSGTLAQVKANFALPLWILAIPWAQELIDQIFFGGQWNLVLHPRSLAGVPGILLSLQG